MDGREEGHEVVAVFVDIGQEYDLDEVRARAAAAGVPLEVVDAREDFIERHCLPALWANALYEEVPAGLGAGPAADAKRSSRSPPVGCDAVAGCAEQGNDQVRFGASFAALAPDLVVMAPIGNGRCRGTKAIELAREWGIPLSAEQRSTRSTRTCGAAPPSARRSRTTWDEPPAVRSRSHGRPRSARRRGRGGGRVRRPVARCRWTAGRSGSAKAIAWLSRIGGAPPGSARSTAIENRLVGIKSRELYEVPGALALIQAHQDLEDLILERDLAHEKAGVERRWAELAYYGL